MGDRLIPFEGLIHGGDYNPDQWLDRPDVLEEDLRLMKLARCNAMSVGIFAWSSLEPREGEFTFDWIEAVIERLHANGIRTILATPSGARPAWMAKKYPEVLRVTPDGHRRRFGERHNHCYTSPVYREKVGIINRELSSRFGKHPAVILWHLSNEYGGECHCDLCTRAFRRWLEDRYGTIENLNRAWWSSFWSHSYSDWDEVDPPSPLGESTVHALNLEWKRFVTARTVDFMKFEIAAVRESSPNIPVTTNLMGFYEGLNPWELVPELDVVSWDSYPGWHGTGPRTVGKGEWDPEGRDWRLAANIAFVHDLNRSLKAKPFLLMESTPSTTNWQAVSKLKRPGMHALSSIQAVAHGSDSVQYFQWRKSRGSFEKFHGAVVDHVGHERTRVFQEVRALGEQLAGLGELAGTLIEPEAAVLYDWENLWALNDAAGPRNDGLKNYREDCLSHYYQLWRRAVATDIIDHRGDLGRYKLLVAPMLYMIREDTAKRIGDFVRSGGTFICTYWSGIVDQNDLCYLGGFPGPLRELLGIWVEEIDALYPGERRTLTMSEGNPLGMTGTYTLRHFWERLHLEGSDSLARFDSDFLKGSPALTRHVVGKGRVYYIASRNEESCLDAFYGAVIEEAGLRSVWPDPPLEGISATRRVGEGATYTLVMNFKEVEQELTLPESLRKSTILVGKADGKHLVLEAFGYAVLRTDR
jgi:beta-galactosidase